jgi:hypothetical protein
MKKVLILTAGWFLTIVGAILSPVPMPVPFPLPIGITMFLVGVGILTTHSKTFRRGVQYLRHHHGWLSRALEAIASHTPKVLDNLIQRIARRRDGRMARGIKRISTMVTDMVHRTRPLAHGRRARMRARDANDTN